MEYIMSNIPIIWLITVWLESFKDEKQKKASYCLKFSEQYISYIQDENKFNDM
jgi:hypothetical protein